ncbi:MAG: GNAT family N-acetyltransferase [Pseudomonadota bacterium]
MIQIRNYVGSDFEKAIDITERAWAPVFPLMQEDIPKYVYTSFYPEGWKKRQLQEVEAVCSDGETDVWVAEGDGRVLGYLGLRTHPEDSMGEIYIIAVDPSAQQRGVGKALMEFAFE